MWIYLAWIPLFEDREIRFDFTSADVTIYTYQSVPVRSGLFALGERPVGEKLWERQ